MGCEQKCVEWGEREMFLKVRNDNSVAGNLYEAAGYAEFDVRATWQGTPDWQVRWKGGLAPLRLMQKPVGSTFNRLLPEFLAPRRTPFKSVGEFQVNFDQVRALGARDALIWFALLLLRNVSSL